MANAIMHTTGQGFVMSFQAGGPHAQDRGLEAVATAYAEMMRVPGAARWEKPQGKADPVRLDKTYTIMPRGIGLIIGCSTFPTFRRLRISPPARSRAAPASCRPSSASARPTGNRRPTRSSRG